MLHKQHRLPSCLIPEVLKKGRRCHSSSFILITNHQSPITNHQFSRFAFIIPLKVDKRSTKRNKIKRQLRNIIRKMLPKIAPGYNIIILAKKEILKLNYAQLEKELRLFFQKTNLLKQNEKFFLANNSRR